MITAFCLPLVLGLIIVFIAGELLVQLTTFLSYVLRISPFFLALMATAFATSLPEMFTTISASLKGSDGIILGNIVGSNIANTFLILGLGFFLYPFRQTTPSFPSLYPSLLWLTVIVGVFVILYTIEAFVFYAGLILVLLFLLTFLHCWKKSPLQPPPPFPPLFRPLMKKASYLVVPSALGMMLLTGGIMYWGSNLFVTGGIGFATYFHLPHATVGLLIIAVGTSLPELAVTFSAMRKGQIALGVGNIVGSNIINPSLVLASALFIGDIATKNQNLDRDIYIFLIASSLGLLLLKSCPPRLIGALFLGIYGLFFTLRLFV